MKLITGPEKIDSDENSNCKQKEKNPPMKIKEDFDNLYDLLITEAPKLPGDCKLQILPKDISWIDPKLLEEGREFVKENYFSIGVMHALAILFGLSLKSECVVMLRTGKYHQSNYASFLKILSTGLTIVKWYDDDILSEGSRSFKSIQFVRRMHLGAAKWRERNKKNVPSLDDIQIPEDVTLFIEAIKTDLEVVDTSEAPTHLNTWTPTVEFSQFDNVLALWAVYAAPYLFAKQIGISDLKFYDGYRHMWAVYGKLLGIEDRFNMALLCPPEMTYRCYTNCVVASLKDIDLLVAVAQRTYVDALANLSPFARIKPIVYYFLKNTLSEFQGDNLYSLMSSFDKSCLYLIYFGIWITLRFKFVKQFTNWMARVIVEHQITRHVPRLARK